MMPLFAALRDIPKLENLDFDGAFLATGIRRGFRFARVQALPTSANFASV